MNGEGDRISSYLLGELEPAEASAFERRLGEDPALREEVERLRPVVGRLETLPAEVWEAPEPPPLVMPEETADARSAPARRRRRLPAFTLRPAAATGLAALLLAVGVAAGTLLGGGSSDSGGGTTDLVLEQIDDGPAGAHGDVLLAGDGAQATVDVNGLDPSDPGNFYELWLLDDGGRMISLGSFRVGADGHAAVELPIPVAPSRYQYFDLSLQEDNGDPAHSGVSVLRGPTASS